MLRPFRADLHMHTCLSPCAELDMTPRAIVRRAVECGLGLIAVTDHNSAENVEAAMRAAHGKGLEVLAGMEITTSEEVHVIALFESTEQALAMQDVVYKNLSSGENDERLYGHQVIVNENDEVTGFTKRLLIGATRLNARATLDLIRSFHGLAIASHVDREVFSVLSQLGFLPEDLRFDAIEMSPGIGRERAETSYGHLKCLPWVSFSDAHHVRDIGRRVTTFTMQEPTFDEIARALKGSGDRSLFWD